MRLLSGEAMVAPLAERLGIPYPATDKSCHMEDMDMDMDMEGLKNNQR